MKAVIQRVHQARVRTEAQTAGSIEKGLLVFLGVGVGDTRANAEQLAQKLIAIRVFEDEVGKINRSIVDVGGSLLVVSQFTLCADTTRGNRPSFSHAADPETARALYEYFLQKCRESGVHVESGVFGAHMDIALVNDGPFTILIESNA